MNDLAERQEAQAPAVAGETGAVLAMIERVAHGASGDRMTDFDKARARKAARRGGKA